MEPILNNKADIVFGSRFLGGDVHRVSPCFIMKKELKNYYEPFMWLFLLIQLVFLVVKMRFSLSIIPIAFSPDAASGESLSRTVIEASNLIKKNSLRDFSLSQEIIGSDLDFTQRMSEYNYPARLKDNSVIIVTKLGEKEFNECRLIEKGVYVAIYDCANRKY